MGAVAVIGEPTQVDGFGLAGARVFVATTPDEIREAWQRLPDDVDVVILTRLAADAIGADQVSRRPYRVVLPA